MQGDNLRTKTMKEDRESAYSSGYKVFVKHHKILGKIPRSNLQDKVNKNQYKLTCHYV